VAIGGPSRVEAGAPSRVEAGAPSRVSQPGLVRTVVVQPKINDSKSKKLSKKEKEHLLAVTDMFKEKTSSAPITGFTSEGEIFEVLTFKGLVNNPAVSKFIFSRFFVGIYKDILTTIPNFLNYFIQSEDRKKSICSYKKI
jgi:hypothetical protein